MIIKRNDDKRFGCAPNPERGEMMKVARAVKKKGRESRLILAMEFFDQARRRRKSQARPPLARIKSRNGKRALVPGAVKIEMQCVGQRFQRGEGFDWNPVSPARARRRFSAASG